MKIATPFESTLDIVYSGKGEHNILKILLTRQQKSETK